MTTNSTQAIENRRTFLRVATSAAGLALVSCATPGGAAGEARGGEPSVTPAEDLMQEHGVVERLLLVYDEAARRLENQADMPMVTLTTAAGIFRRFVESYHEKNEEQFVFPRMRTAGRELELVGTLLRQHERGRQMTNEIARLAGAGGGKELPSMLLSFSRMYRAHAAREDTVIFPAFREVLGKKAWRDLGEQFEAREHKLFGEHGFEEIVGQVARLEVTLGISDLDALTPA